MNSTQTRSTRGADHRFLQIDREDLAPLYRQLEDILKGEIDRGHYEVGSPLPSESELGTRWDVSRSVVRQTLSSLALHGIIRTEKGRGSFVAEKKVNQSFVQRTTGFFDDLSRLGLQVETRVVRQEIVQVTGEAAEFLGVDRALEIARVRSVEGRVLTFVRTFLIPSECPGLEHVPLDDQSLYGALAEHYGIRIHGGTRTIEAVLAEGEVSRHLGVATGSPLLLLRSAGTEEDGRPIEWFDAWHRADRTRFELMITPEKPVAPLEHRILPPVLVDTEPSPPAACAELNSTLFNVPIVVLVDGEATDAELARAADILYRAGVRTLLLPVASVAHAEQLSALRAGRDGLAIGVTSVNSAILLSRAQYLMPDLIVSDVMFDEPIELRARIPVILGGSTATEIYRAWERTQAPIQVAPVGDAVTFKELADRLPEIPLLPRLPRGNRSYIEYLSAGTPAVVATVTVTDLSDAGLIKEIRSAAKSHIRIH